MGIATLLALSCLVLCPQGWPRVSGFLSGAVFMVLAALALNIPFLIALRRRRGFSFMLKSAAFLLVDLYASGLGIAWGIWDYVRGTRY